MTKLFEIFSTEIEMKTKDSSINTLLGYPKNKDKMDVYRVGFQKYQGTDWAACVDDELINACSGMTPEQRAQYYDDSDLKSYQWLIDNNWYAPY